MSADYAGAIWVPAHPHNIRPGTNHPKVLVLHTPEEPADEIEVTPFYFARDLLLLDPPRRASTHYYMSGARGAGVGSDGDLYQMVREDGGAIANGVLNKPYPPDTNGSISLNLQSLSLEIEGYAATIHQTCHPATKQWQKTAEWIETRSRKYDIPLDRAHVIGHYQVASNRTDPGKLNIDALVQHALSLRATPKRDILLLEDDMASGFVKLSPTEEDPDDPGRVWAIGLHTKRKLYHTRPDLAKQLGVDNAVTFIEKKTLDSLTEIVPPVVP